MNRDFFYNWHKSVLKKHTSEVDVDAIWAAIEPEVDGINVERKRRRGFFFFLFGLSMVILGVGYMSLFAPTISPTQVNLKKSISNTSLSDKEGIEIDNNSIADIQSAKAAIEKNATYSNNTPPQTNSSTLFPSKISSSSKKVNDAIIQEKTRRNGTPNATSEVRISPSNYITRTNTVESISQNKFSNSIGGELNLGSAAKGELALEQERLLAVDAISHTSLLPMIAEEEKPLPASEIIIPKENPFQFSVSIYSGIGFANKSLSIKVGHEADEILLLRNATEKSLEVLNNGIKVGLSHKSGFNASLGFQYARVAERFQYDTRFLELDSIPNQVIGYSNNLLGTQNVITGYAPNNTIHDLEYDFYNNYHFLEIPISIGYQKRIKSWNIGLRASYLQNISLRTKGRVLDSSFEVVNATDENDLFESRLSASFEGGIHVDYNFTPRVSIGMETFYRLLPQSITTQEYSLNQNYNWIGLNASLKYSF